MNKGTAHVEHEYFNKRGGNPADQTPKDVPVGDVGFVSFIFLTEFIFICYIWLQTDIQARQ